MSVILLSGMSGAGKTYIETLLKQKGFINVVSSTTRPKRDGEVDGEDYHFLTKEEFRHRVTQQRFIEHETVFGNLYGVEFSSLESALESKAPLVLVLEPRGIESLTKKLSADDIPFSVFFIEAKANDLVAAMLARIQNDQDNIKAHISRIERSLTEEILWMNLADWPRKIISERDKNKTYQVISEIITCSTNDTGDEPFKFQDYPTPGNNSGIKETIEGLIEKGMYSELKEFLMHSYIKAGLDYFHPDAKVS